MYNKICLLFIFTLIVCLTGLPVFCQDSLVIKKIDDKKSSTHLKGLVKYKHSFGIGAGFTTGVGFSYRFMPNKFGFQINAFPIYEDYGKYGTISVGFTLLSKLAENRTNNLYFYLSNHYFYSKTRPGNVPIWTIFDIYSTSSYNNTGVNETKRSWRTGVGLGFEFNTRKRVVLNVMAGYAQYDMLKTLNFTGELALYYRFGIMKK